MRNIICISVILASTASVAQDMPDGCYQRIYSAEHLRDNPDQTVSELTMEFGQFSAFFDLDEDLQDTPVVRVEALMASIPSTTESGTAGRRFSSVLFCGQHRRHRLDPEWMQDGAVSCSGECDGGTFQVVSANETEMLIRTQGVRLTACGEMDGFAMLKDDQDGPTTYKLFAAPAESCAPGEDVIQ